MTLFRSVCQPSPPLLQALAQPPPPLRDLQVSLCPYLGGKQGLVLPVSLMNAETICLHTVSRTRRAVEVPQTVEYMCVAAVANRKVVWLSGATGPVTLAMK